MFLQCKVEMKKLKQKLHNFPLQKYFALMLSESDTFNSQVFLKLASKLNNKSGNKVNSAFRRRTKNTDIKVLHSSNCGNSFKSRFINTFTNYSNILNDNKH